MKFFFTAAALAVSGSAFVAADNEQFSGRAENHVRGGHSSEVISAVTMSQEERHLDTTPSTSLVCTVTDGSSNGDGGDSMPTGRVCRAPDLTWEAQLQGLLANIPGAAGDITADGYNTYSFLESLQIYAAEGYTVGSIQDLVVEAADASITGAPVEDGKSGDIAFPFGQIRPIVTAGERSACPESLGEVIVGKPDGMGAYLKDDETVRVLFQSESYGPLTANEAWAYPVNNGGALIGGSHINYIDYDREMFSNFMNYNGPASDMVVGMGQHIKRAYNLRGEPLGRRNKQGDGFEPTAVGAHLSNTDADGVWAMEAQYLPRIEYDWFYQSFCSAHMDEKHQWGPGIGYEDDLYMTNEEWHRFDPTRSFVGNSYHALDVATDTIYAVGALSLGGFEKSAEINSQHPDYVMIAISGYNGAYGSMTKVIEDRNTAYGNRTIDDTEYISPQDMHPYRFYLGVKGLMEDGSAAPADDFLARNGLRYGQIYGYAIDMSANGPTQGAFRDAFHKTAVNGDAVPGKWVAQPWRWDGTVRNFEHDGSWDFQDVVPDIGVANLEWWNGNGYSRGIKTEHLSPDINPGTTGYIQTSTAGYFGHLYVDNVPTVLNGLASKTDLPASFDGRYFVYQGETDITSQVMLGGKGQYVPDETGAARDATCNYDQSQNAADCKVTFEDIDGFEYICGSDCCRAVLQEDSGNDLGERMLISSCLEHDADGQQLEYYFVAMSGGSDNTRMKAGVGIPKTSNEAAGAHEFSGVFDLSGLTRKENGEFTVMASDDGFVKRQEEMKVSTNEKYIMINVQASNMNDRIMVNFGADTGGQVMIYKPSLPN